MKLTVALALMTACLPLSGADLIVAVTAPRQAIHAGDYPRFAVTISNRGPNSVTLVEPGDGSDCAWRTPVVGWSILSVTAYQQKHPATPALVKERFCGNINSINSSEVFSLKPGETHRFGSWIGHPRFKMSGQFRVVFYYQNIPDSKISGLLLKPHEDGVLDRIRQSTPCKLVSEEIIVDVFQAPPKRRAEVGVHTVGKGDTLTKIARRFQVSVKELLALNPDVDPKRLRIGQILTVNEVEE